jgi:hypothetical protein
MKAEEISKIRDAVRASESARRTPKEQSVSPIRSERQVKSDRGSVDSQASQRVSEAKVSERETEQSAGDWEGMALSMIDATF